MVERTDQRFKDLLVFSAQIGTETLVEENLKKALAAAIRSTGSISGSILVKQENTTELTEMAKQGDGLALSSNSGDVTVEQVFSSGQPVVIGRSLETGSQEEPGGPAMIVPMKAAGRIVGVLSLQAEMDVQEYARDDLALAIAFANQAALILENEQFRAAMAAAMSTKNEYISLVAHQLRVPLTSIAGYTDLILSGMVGPLPDRQEEFLRRVKRNTERMSALIRNLSDISRLESGKMTYECSKFDIVQLAEKVVEDAALMIRQREQKIKMDIMTKPLTVFADRTITSRVLTDLLTNASQYSSDGDTITVRVEPTDGCARVAVTDNGIGISDNDQKKLFTLFFRSEDPAVRKKTGWGLSLALDKLLIKGQDGQIRYHSRLGYGSTFLLILPLAE